MWKKLFYGEYDSNYETDSATACPGMIGSFWHLRRRGGNVMDLDGWRWLDYDIVALVILVLVITLLELTVLGF